MKDNRLLYIDNIKLLMIILVVVQHLAVTYSGIGDWYYISPRQINTIEMVLFGFHQSFTQAYFMGVLFLIAGYFVPISYNKKGFSQFIKERCIRLGIPVLIYMLVIDPFINIVLLKHWDFTNTNFFNVYFRYIVNFQFIGSSGPLWFAFALLIFSIIYAFIKKIFPKKIESSTQKLPTTLKVFAIILIMSICTFLIRLIQPIGTSILNMQLCFFPQYIILFVIGITSRRKAWFEKVEYFKGKLYLILGIVVGLISWLVFMIMGGALSGNLDVFYGGLTWQSVVYSLWEAFVAVSMSIGLIGLFKGKYNKQSTLIQMMSDNAFSVYVFHAPILVALSLLFQSIDMMPFVKFIILIPINILVCFTFSNLVIRKIPIFSKLL